MAVPIFNSSFADNAATSRNIIGAGANPIIDSINLTVTFITTTAAGFASCAYLLQTTNGVNFYLDEFVCTGTGAGVPVVLNNNKQIIFPGGLMLPRGVGLNSISGSFANITQLFYSLNIYGRWLQ
jgi:hypothetical protein